MADFVTLSCPTCGGKLQVTNDLDRFACAHCGREHIVRRGGGIVALQPVAEELSNIRLASNKTASEMAISRLQDELVDLRIKLHRIEEEILGSEGAVHEIGFQPTFNNSIGNYYSYDERGKLAGKRWNTVTYEQKLKTLKDKLPELREHVATYKRGLTNWRPKQNVQLALERFSKLLNEYELIVSTYHIKSVELERHKQVVER